jgi:zinc resistance-associated protein
MVGLAGATALAAVAGLAHAQDGGPFRDDPRFRERLALSAEDRAAFTEARIAALRAGLKLSPEQEKLWPPVEDAIRGLARQRQETRLARRERFLAMRDQGLRDVPGQLRFMADSQAASAEALRRLADATSPLYGSLNDGQKRRLGMLARFLHLGAGPGRRAMRERALNATPSAPIGPGR